MISPPREELPLGIGDVVVLNSGGPKMTVVGRRGCDQVRCVWTSNRDELEDAWFPVVCVYRMRGDTDVGVA